MAERKHIVHPIPPLYDSNSRVLILGSFPSVKSREAAFFYGHPQNRFWKVMTKVLEWPAVPADVEEKSRFLHDSHIALWDTIASCDIIGSSDSSIRNVTANDLSIILDAAPVEKIFCNGTASHNLYMKYIYPVMGRESIKLPSTSPANAAWSIDRLAEAWKQIRI